MKKIKIPLVLAGIIISASLVKGQSLASLAYDDTEAQITTGSPGNGPALKVTGYLREPRFWVSPDYIHYWQSATLALPNLLDLSTAGGMIGSEVYNQHRTTFDNGNAVRLSLGGWLDPNEKIGMELSGFYTPKQTETDSFAGTPTGPLLAAPLLDYSSAILHNFQLGGLGVQGFATFKSTTESYSGEGDVLVHVTDFTYRKQLNIDVSGLGGIRYFGVADDFQENLGRQGSANNFSATDDYRTQNNFYGVNLGTHIRAHYNGFFADLTPKIGLGVSDESVDVSGSYNSPAPIINPGGFLAIGNKLGNQSADKFALLPQVTLKVGYDINKRVEFFAGYDLLYLSEVARASGQVTNQVDIATSPTAVVGGVPGASDNSPKPPVSSTSFFEQGVTAGVTAKF